MLTLLPRSLCSWNYRACEGRATIAMLDSDFFSEQGRIEFGGTAYRIVKHGLASGRWSLLDGAETIAAARKPRAFFREFEIRLGASTLMLKTENAFTRAYRFGSNTGWSGTLRPVHPFTRRAVVECTPSTPPLAQLFCFWLAALTWRRSVKSSAAHA